MMNSRRLIRVAALVVAGTLWGILPGCVEVYLLNIATPFLL